MSNKSDRAEKLIVSMNSALADLFVAYAKAKNCVALVIGEGCGTTEFEFAEEAGDSSFSLSEIDDIEKFRNGIYRNFTEWMLAEGEFHMAIVEQ